MTSRPLKWHGGKHYLVKHILPRIPPHTHYVEPFFGSGAVFFSKPASIVQGHSEVINDLHKDLACFYVVLRNEKTFEDFMRRVELTPFSELEWQYACRPRKRDPVGQALAFFIRYRQSRQGIGRSFATLSRNRTRKGMNEQVASWLSAVDGLYEAHERLKRVVILNDHAQNVIVSQDGPNTFFYLDPPYVQSTRTAPNTYEHEMNAGEHADLLRTLSHIEGKFLLSGYPSPMYERLAEKHGWICEQVHVPNSASNDAAKELKIECFWRNYVLPV